MRDLEGTQPSVVGFQPLQYLVARESDRVKGDENLKTSLIYKSPNWKPPKYPSKKKY